MTGFGDKLRREREMRGVSLEEIAESTKIGTRSLRALEEDDFEKLPGGIFNKGFVRAYSRFLGLDEERTVADFDAALKEYQLAKGQVDEVKPEEEEPDPAGSRALLLIAVGLALIIAVAAAAYFLSRSNRAQAAASSADVAHESRTMPPASTVSDNPAKPSAQPVSTAPAPQQQITPLTPEHQKPLTSAAVPETANIVSAKPQPETTDKQSVALVASASPIHLQVVAHEESWLSVSADGRNLGQQTLAAQQSRTINAQKEVRLKLGNVGGVEVSFNGKPVNIDGEPKQVKELTFTPDGLHQ